MIRAFIFDLDGTLVQTEKLKAVSYARAAFGLCPGCAREQEIIEAFKDLAGRPREEVARSLVDRFGLRDAARARMQEFRVSEPWQAYVHVRLRIYKEMVADEQLIRQHECRNATDLLRRAKSQGFRTALTTTSHRDEACRILDILDVDKELDFVATFDDVEQTKPHPEIYLLASHCLGVPPGQCLAIEDSVPGIRSALSAGMWCIAVTNEFTRDAVHAAHILEEKWIVDDDSKLEETTRAVIHERVRV